MTTLLRSAVTRLTIVALVFTGAVWPQSGHAQFKPDDPALYDTIVHMDSVFFAAYNTCTVHLAEYADFYADNLEFYHDKGGLMDSKKDVVASTKKYVCGYTTRELVPGSIEVYPIANYGAVEIGFHKFHNSREPDAPARPGRFVVIWHRTDKGWKITRVVSLH